MLKARLGVGFKMLILLDNSLWVCVQALCLKFHIILNGVTELLLLYYCNTFYICLLY